jgi:hypothetical protein
MFTGSKRGQTFINRMVACILQVQSDHNLCVKPILPSYLCFQIFELRHIAEDLLTAFNEER